jgi:hypothetical protein
MELDPGLAEGLKSGDCRWLSSSHRRSVGWSFARNVYIDGEAYKRTAFLLPFDGY